MKKPIIKVFFHSSENMYELNNETVRLIITSPPYYGVNFWKKYPELENFFESREMFFNMLNNVWLECWRVLKPFGKLCINYGDVFSNFNEFGRVKETHDFGIINKQLESIGFDLFGRIIWDKGSIMDNSVQKYQHIKYLKNNLDMRIDPSWEYIFIYRKTFGEKENGISDLTYEEWKKYYQGVWEIKPIKDHLTHPSMFPEEIPYRLIKMYSYRRTSNNKRDTILDPFLGSGTTLKVSISLDRNAIGYEILKNFKKTIQEKVDSKID
ncbi:MAG: DNA-methyltransferase [Candidatus Helarchaeota archaeon]